MTLRVTSASLLAATTPEGRARKRARLTVRAIVTNSGATSASVPVQRLFLRESDSVARPDAPATDAAGPLLSPVPAAGTAGGELDFEIEGAVTDVLSKARQVNIRFGPQAVLVKLG